MSIPEHPGEPEVCVQFTHLQGGGGFLARATDLVEVGDGSFENGLRIVAKRFSRLTKRQQEASIQIGDIRWIFDMADEA